MDTAPLDADRTDLDRTDLARLAADTLALTGAVAAYLRAEFGRVHATQIEVKSLNSLVSHVDKEAERRLVDGLAALLPGCGFLAEEGTAGESPDSPWRWVIDPLDGTTNFLHRLPCFAVSVGLQYGGETVLGVVEDVMQHQTYHSYRGASAAYLGGVALPRLGAVDLAGAVLATGIPAQDFSHAGAYLRLTDDLMRHSRGLRRWGAAAIDLAYVASGRFQGFYEYALQPWDVCAGALLVRAAGGVVTDFGGGDGYGDGSSIVAAAPGVHAELRASIAAAGLTV